MKKIGLWMAALTAVTVGGVYATFNYTDTGDMNSSTDRTAIGVTDAVHDGAAGVLTVDAKGLTIMIDSAASIMGDALGETNAHKAMITATGSVVVTFTPNANLKETDILTNGIHANVSFSASWGNAADWKYTWGEEDISIFSAVNANEVEIHQIDEADGSKQVWTKDESTGVFTYTITAEDLFKNAATDLLVMNDIVLETIEEHEAFEATFTGKQIAAVVTPAGDDD